MAFKTVSKKGNGDFPAKWDKLVTKSIEGEVIEYKRDIMGKPGANAVTLRTDDGDFTVWIDKVLMGYEENYVEGTKIKFTYLGKKKTKKGFDYNDYEVAIDGGDEEVMPF